MFLVGAEVLSKRTPPPGPPSSSYRYVLDAHITPTGACAVRLLFYISLGQVGLPALVITFSGVQRATRSACPVPYELESSGNHNFWEQACLGKYTRSMSLPLPTPAEHGSDCGPCGPSLYYSVMWLDEPTPRLQYDACLFSYI